MNKVFSMIGLATRAGKTVAGEFSVEKAIKQRKAQVVIVSKEASSLIHTILVAMQNNLSIDDLKKVCFAHPTYSEGIFDLAVNN